MAPPDFKGATFLGVLLARRIQAAPGLRDVSEKVRFGLRLTLAREPTPRELHHLETLYRDELVRFRANPQKARRLLGDWGLRLRENSSEIAAWFLVANALLNLDEAITKG